MATHGCHVTDRQRSSQDERFPPPTRRVDHPPLPSTPTAHAVRPFAWSHAAGSNSVPVPGSPGRKSAATRSAVCLAHAPVVSRPMVSTAMPHPASSHQPTWLAGTKPVLIGPAIAETTTEPITATPSEEPTCLLVEATAAATPACVLGIPDIAVFVIGALTSPNPRPKSR